MNTRITHPRRLVSFDETEPGHLYKAFGGEADDRIYLRIGAGMVPFENGDGTVVDFIPTRELHTTQWQLATGVVIELAEK